MKRNAVAWAALVVSTAALVSSRGLTRPLPAAPRLTAEGQKTAHVLSDHFGELAELVKPSVVQISVEKKAGGLNLGRGNRRSPFPGPNGPQMDPKDLEDLLKKFFGPDAQGHGPGQPEKQQFGAPTPKGARGVGSGFVYDDRGHILTNNHVVENAGKIGVTFNDGVEHTATVVGTDPQTDVAVIKVDNTSYQPLPKGHSHKLKVGELVMAVGSPYDLSQSVTTGIISAVDRTNLGINGRDSFESFLQTDAAINPGNSGGPLVNMDGEVIGVNSAIVTGGHGNDGVGFAIPIDLARSIADNLIQNGKVRRSRVGIALEPLAPAMAKQLGLDAKVKGVLIGDVVKGSPAEKAGLKSGDVITGFNGAPVTSLPTFRLTVASSESGREFGLTYWRDGKEHKTTIVPAPADQVVFAQERGREGTPAEKKSDAPKVDISDFGLELQALTPELAAQFGHLKDAKGLWISDVKEGSPADVAGLEAGQLITKIVKDHKIQTITSVKDFQTFASQGDEVAFYVEVSKGVGHYVTLSKAKKN
jgi:serine protease Do